jgi:hypothetical protein
MRWDGVLFEPPKASARFSTIAAARRDRRRGQPTGKLDMPTMQGTPDEAHMSTTQGTLEQGTVDHAGNTSVHHAGNGVCTMQGTGFYFPGATYAGNTWDADEHELATRFQAALSVRDRSPKD